MTSINNSGDNGSPWCNPRAWQIHWLGAPFSRTLVLAERRSSDTQFIQALEKSKWCRISKRNAHATESKALERSALNRMVGFLSGAAV
jgi:hypothetical protein